MEYVRPAYKFRKNNCHNHVLSPNVDHWNQWECGAIREGYVRNFQKLILLLNIADQLKQSFLTLDYVPVKKDRNSCCVLGCLWIVVHLSKLLIRAPFSFPLIVLLGQKFNV